MKNMEKSLIQVRKTRGKARTAAKGKYETKTQDKYVYKSTLK